MKLGIAFLLLGVVLAVLSVVPIRKLRQAKRAAEKEKHS